MRYRYVLTSLTAVTSIGLVTLLFTGCQDNADDAGDQPASATENDSKPDEVPVVPLVPAALSPEPVESESQRPQGANAAEPSRPGVDIDVGGGEGVRVDVDLPDALKKPDSADDESGFRLDVGGGAIDVDVDREDDDAKDSKTP